MEACLARVKPDAVINCIGIVKQRDEAKRAILPKAQALSDAGRHVVEVPGDHESRHYREEGAVARGLPDEVGRGEKDETAEGVHVAAPPGQHEAGHAKREHGEVGEEVGIGQAREGDEISDGLQLADVGAVDSRAAELVELFEGQADRAQSVGTHPAGEYGRGAGQREELAGRAGDGRRIRPQAFIDQPDPVRRQDERAEDEEAMAVDPENLHHRQQP